MENNYYKTKASVDEYVKLAKDVNGSELIKKLKHFLSPKSKLLELGSGPGTDWNLLNNLYDVTGSDNSKEFLQYLKTNFPKGQFVELDAESISTNKKFDGIYTNKVLHHLTDKELQNSIKRQHEILNADGIICHSFWKGEDSEIFKGLFVNYHTKQALKDFFDKHFEILLLDYYAEFEEEDSILLIGKKK